MSESLAPYFTKVQQLHKEAKKEQLISYIEEQIASNPDEGLAPFFQAEHAFYQGEYEEALSHYLRARQTPHFQFFCYRCSAFVSHAKGHRDQALRFLSKATTLLPEDSAAEQLHILLSQEAEIKEIESLPVQNQLQPAELPTRSAIAEEIAAHEKWQENRLDSYIQAAKKERAACVSSAVWLFSDLQPRSFPLPPLEKLTTGLFVRWQGYGIAINPGVGFIEKFHAEGLHIRDIDQVIVTRSEKEAWADVQKIYQINGEINKVDPDFHLIGYLLNPGAYQHLAQQLKAQFKQEKSTVQSLELFVDSSEVEQLKLNEQITLHYFSLSPQIRHTHLGRTASLGIRLHCQGREESATVGYISGASWTPLIAHNLGKCDLLITGFGTTDRHDYEMLTYNEQNLGYYGTFSLAEALLPSLLLCSEFEGTEGDLRLEMVKKLRRELPPSITVLPADCGICIALAPLEVRCTATQRWTPPEEVRVVQLTYPFGPLHYLSQNSLI